MVVDLSLSDHFRAFAATVERDGGTTYASICRGVSEDPQVLALLEQAPVAQRRPILLLAAVHDLLLAGADHPLAAWYDTVAAVRSTEPARPHGDVAAAFADFCRVNGAELAELVTTRSTQTNEVGRCTSLLPALCTVAELGSPREPLSLLDLGCSAGLNLLFDDYGYTYRGRDGAVVATAGHPGAVVALECTVRGDPPWLPELHLPAVAERVGLDLSPLDPLEDDAARWLLACQWPDNPARFGRLRAALARARAAPRPPRLERGDMVDDLPRVAASIGGTHPLVVFHSWVAAYLDEPRQYALVAAVEELGRSRPVHHVYCEAPFETPGLPTPPPPVRGDGPDLTTALVHIGPGGAAPVRLADTHPHGYWIRWWPGPLTPRGPTARPGAPVPALPDR
ncbi:MAG TPA: DUF2332 domain-containing protein [Acidimicrobiales bacterium]|nr:DUF2332 domain-containing protein [Acidimicrobiales bacterium]